jgi:hypothetical protein
MTCVKRPPARAAHVARLGDPNRAMVGSEGTLGSMSEITSPRSLRTVRHRLSGGHRGGAAGESAARTPRRRQRARPPTLAREADAPRGRCAAPSGTCGIGLSGQAGFPCRSLLGLVDACARTRTPSSRRPSPAVVALQQHPAFRVARMRSIDQNQLNRRTRGEYSLRTRRFATFCNRGVWTSRQGGDDATQVVRCGTPSACRRM